MKLLIEQTVKYFTSRVGQLTEKETHYFSRLLRILTDIHVEEYHHEHEKHLAKDVGLRLTCGKSFSSTPLLLELIVCAVGKIAVPLIFTRRILNA